MKRAETHENDALIIVRLRVRFLAATHLYGCVCVRLRPCAFVSVRAYSFASARIRSRPCVFVHVRACTFVCVFFVHIIKRPDASRRIVSAESGRVFGSRTFEMYYMRFIELYCVFHCFSSFMPIMVGMFIIPGFPSKLSNQVHAQ